MSIEFLPPKSEPKKQTPTENFIIPPPADEKKFFPLLITPSDHVIFSNTRTNQYNNLNNKNSEIKPLTSQIDQEKNNQIRQSRIDQLYSTYTNIANNYKWFIALFSIGIILSLVILGLSTLLFVYNSKLEAAINILMSLLSLIVLSLSIYTIRKNALLIKQVVRMRDDPERILQSRERILLLTCLYFFMCIFLYFFTVANSSIIYQTNVKMNIRGIGYNKHVWEAEFGSSTFSAVINKVSFSLYSLGGICFLHSFLILAIIIWLLVLIQSYRTWKVIMQFVCVIFFQISFVFVYFGTSGMKLRNITGIEDAMPGWVTIGLFVIGIIGIIISLIAFFIVFIEHKILLIIFCVLNGLLSITLILLNIGGTLISANFEGYLEAQCNLLYTYVDQDYLDDHLECKDKYLFTTNSIENIKCPKHRIIIAWELDEEEEEEEEGNGNGNGVKTYGCINQKCCMTAYSYIKEQYDYLTLLSYLLMIISVLLIFCSLYLIKNSEIHFDEGIRSKSLYIFMLTMSIIITVVMIPILNFIPDSPSSSQFTEIKPKETNIQSSVAKSLLVVPGDEVQMNDINNKLSTVIKSAIIFGNQYKIEYGGNKDYCLKQFEFMLKNKNGYFNLADDLPNDMVVISNQRIDNLNRESVLVFRGTEKIINSYLNYLSIDLICKYSEGFVDLKITSIVEDTCRTTRVLVNDDSNRSLRFTQDANANLPVTIITIDLTSSSLGQNRTVLEKSLDFSLINSTDTVYLYGNVLSKQLISTSIYPLVNKECSSFLQTNYDSNSGLLTIGPLFIHKEGVVVEYNITINPLLANGSIDTTNTYVNGIVLGGISRISKNPQLGTVAFYTNTAKNGLVYGQVINSLNNDPLGNIEIQLYFGYTVFYGTNPGNISSYLSTYSTLQDGFFHFNQLTSGQYTLYFINSNYYIEEIHLIIDSYEIKELNTVPLTSINSIGELSFVLSWENGPADLDLYGSYPIDDELTCTVSFANQKCIEMKMECMNDWGGKHGVEKITIKKIEEYIYMVYVHKYHDTSDNKAEGEEIIEGLEIIENDHIDTSDIPDIPLSQSKAVIKMYGPGYRLPISSLDIPNDEKFDDDYKYWFAFCINGSIGIASYKIVNQMLKTEPDKNYCYHLYNVLTNNTKIKNETL